MYGEILRGACFGNQQDFPAQGAIVDFTFLGQLCPQSRRISFPLTSNIDVL
jgi:hypothetical protein